MNYENDHEPGNYSIGRTDTKPAAPSLPNTLQQCLTEGITEGMESIQLMQR